MKNLKVIIPAGYLPDGAIVTRPTGSVEYTVRHQIKVYNEKGEPQNIGVDGGGVYLVGPRGAINVVPFDREVAWEEDLHWMLEFLQEIADAEEDQ